MTATERLLQAHRPADGPLRILAASGQLGYGIPAAALEQGMLRPIGPMSLPSAAEVLQCTHIVGQCGTETLAHALYEQADPFEVDEPTGTLLGQLPQAPAAVAQRVRELVPGDWSLHSHIYGQGAVHSLPAVQHSQHEAGLVIEFIAPWKPSFRSPPATLTAWPGTKSP